MLHFGVLDHLVPLLALEVGVQRIDLSCDDLVQTAVIDVDDQHVFCVDAFLLQDQGLFQVLWETLDDVVLVACAETLDALYY